MGIFRRTLTGTLTGTRSDRSSSTSSHHASGATSPSASSTAPFSTSLPSTNPPPIPLTKTPSRLGLSRNLTWGKRREEDKQRRRIEDWEREDENEWNAPSVGRPGWRMCSKKHQEVLRAFEWKMDRESLDGGRCGSMFSGISPGCSRMNSVDDGHVGLHSSARQRSLAQNGPLSRETSRSEETLRD